MWTEKYGKILTSESVGTGPSSYEKEFTGPRSGVTKVEKRCARVTPPSVESSLPVLVRPSPPFPLKTGGSPSEIIVFNKEHLYTTTYRYNKRQK